MQARDTSAPIRRQMMSFYTPTIPALGSQGERSPSSFAPTGNDTQPMNENTSLPDSRPPLSMSTVMPCVKVQRKGTQQIGVIPIILVQSFGNLLICLQRVFHHPSFLTPEITTFDGHLLSDSSSYLKFLKPGLHLIISYPMSSRLRWSPPFSSSCSSQSCPSTPKTVNPAELTLSQLSSPERRKLGSTRRYPEPLHFQPPSLSFFAGKEVPVNVILGNKRFPLVKDLLRCLQERKADLGADVQGDSLLNREFGAPTGEFRQQRPDLSQGLAARHRIIPKGAFPTTTWEVFAQSGASNKKLVCGVNWDVLATPEGIVYSYDKMETTREGDMISWDLGDIAVSGGHEEDDDDMGDNVSDVSDDSYIRPAEQNRPMRRRDTVPGGGKISWVNHGDGEEEDGECNEGEDREFYSDFTSPIHSRRLRSGKFWMLHPPRSLPTSLFFLPLYGSAKQAALATADTESDINILAFPSPSDFFIFLNSFLAKLTTCLPSLQSAAKVTSILHHFEQELDNGYPKDRSAKLAIKFLSPKEIQEIFPTTIEPIPDIFVRLFLVIWIVDHSVSLPFWETYDEQKLTKLADSLLLNGPFSGGVGPTLKILEWGGIILANPTAAMDSPRSESSDTTIHPRSPKQSEDFAMVDDDERRRNEDVPMADGFVVGEEGINPYYAHESDLE